MDARDALPDPGAPGAVDFPRGRLSTEYSVLSALPWRPWTLALLLLACLIPRAVAAWNWDVLWGDSLRYVYASMALEQGNFDEGFAEFGLNTYPLILIPLRHLGVDWQIAGKYFGVLMASLTVLPLWGWLRRMFAALPNRPGSNESAADRLAVVACLVYALHGKLIAISPLIIRDSTFWFLMAAALYYAWRAAAELRVGFFLAAGAALTLAVHTRTEGWLLLIPLLGWGACRWPTAKGKRVRLAFGALLAIAMIPTAVTAVNFTWLRENPRWDVLRTDHLKMAVAWWNSASGMHVGLPDQLNVMPRSKPFLQTPPPRIADGERARGGERETRECESPPLPVSPSPLLFSSKTLPVPVFPEQSTPGWLLTFKLVERLAKGFTWVGSALLLIGLVYGRRIFLRPEHLTLFCMSLLLIVVSRIRYWAGGLDLRYFMPVVILGLPWMALGLEYVLAAARRLVERQAEPSPRTLRVLAGSLIAVAATCSFLDAPMSAAAYMRKHAALGRWIYDRAGPEPAIVGNLDYKSLEAFYSNGRVVGILLPGDQLSTEYSVLSLPAALTERKADVVVLWNEEHVAHDRLANLQRRIADGCGYRRVVDKELPADENELLVFLRKE